MLLEHLLNILVGAAILLGLFGLIMLGVAYWSIVGPVIIGILLVAVAWNIGDLIRD